MRTILLLAALVPLALSTASAPASAQDVVVKKTVTHSDGFGGTRKKTVIKKRGYGGTTVKKVIKRED